MDGRTTQMKSGMKYVRSSLIREAIRRYERRRIAILETSRVPIVGESTCSRLRIESWDINAIRALISLNEEATDER
jgi:hypothetical protein